MENQPSQIAPISPRPPLIRVQGSHREIGQQIGEACKAQIHHSIQNAHQIIEQAHSTLGLNWAGAQIQARKYLPFAQERYPKYVNEMTGLAEGAGVTLEDVAVVNAMEGVTMDALHLTKCTSMAVNQECTTDEHVLIGHNEDWLPEDEEDIYLVHASPRDEPPFLAMTYGALLPNIGFNAAGIAQCCDTVYPNDTRIGTPRVIVSRAVLGARTLLDAVRLAVVPQRAAGYNHILVSESGEILSVEVSARHFCILYGEDGTMVHTNHYLDRKMQEIEDEPEEMISTKLRYFRARRLIKKTRHHSIRSLQAILRDHENHPDAICNHSENEVDPMDREKTIASLIIDLTARAMHIAWGNPCTAEYHTFYLDA